MTAAAGDVWIIGPGRMGLALGSQLLASGWAPRLTFIGRRTQSPTHPVFNHTEVSYTVGLPSSEGGAPRVILITTSDGAIREIAKALLTLSASSSVSLAESVVLHTSGVLGSDALLALSGIVGGLASLHPLVSVADPERDARRLGDGWYGIEGDPAGQATAEEIVTALGGRSLAVRSGDKALYHAAAVFASNFLVASLSVAERLMEDSGVNREDARAALAGLAAGTLANVAAVGPSEALTGPVSRGDSATVERHLLRLSEGDRLLYSGLAREALRLAVARGLPAEAEQRISDLLESELP